MRKVIISAPGTVGIVDAPTPQLTSGSILVEPLLVGVCGTDRELFEGSMVYLRSGVARYPLTPGHEWVGRVVESTDELRLPPGSLVVGECSLGCGECERCAHGSYHLCAQRSETGIVGQEGALAERMLFPAAAAHRVPDSVALADAALIEPAAVAFRAIRRLAPPKGATVLIVGGGTLGALCAQILQRVNHTEVAVLDPQQSARDALISQGARTPLPDEQFNFVLEAAGHPSAIGDALRHTAPGGRVVAIGLSGHATSPVPIDTLVVSDHEIVGSIGSPGVWPEVIGLIATGLIAPSEVVTDVVSLDQIETAMQAPSRSGYGSKVLVTLGDHSH